VRTKAEASATIRALSNPVAYRVLATVGMRGPQTTAELAGALGDVPTSSLYRQLSRLRDAGILRVSAERQARGAVERTYALASREAGAMTAEEVAAAPVSQLRATLRNFMAAMFADTSAYIGSRAFGRGRLWMGASLAVTELTDEAYAGIRRELHATLARAGKKSAGKATSRKRYIYLVTMPELASKT
jgi:DNA-binding transcriptional ArsR family regulator